MKRSDLAFVCLLLFPGMAAFVQAQEAKPKETGGTGKRKVMIFQPGASLPEGMTKKPEPEAPAQSQPVANGVPSAPVQTPGAKQTPASGAVPVAAGPQVESRSGRVDQPALAEVNDLPSQLVGNFFAALKKGEVDAAYEALTKGSKIAQMPEESKALRDKTRQAIEVFGSVVNFELLESRTVGSHLLRRSYMSAGKEFPLRWRFYFYRPDSRWRLVDLRVDDRLGGFFSEVEEQHAADKP